MSSSAEHPPSRPSPGKPEDPAPHPARPRILPHEIVFNLFLAVTWLRLTAKLGPLHVLPLVFLGCLFGSAAVFVWAGRSPTPFRWRIRLLYYPCAMGVSFFTLEDAIPALGPERVDALLLGWDRALFGETPSISFMAWDGPWLNDVLMAAYLFFFYYLIAGPGHYCIRNLPLFRKCFAGLFTLYGIGLLSYTLMPAGGPHLFMKFAEPLEGPFVIKWTLAPINAASNGVDVFPSLHVGISCYLLVFDWWHRRTRFWWFLVPCLLLWSASVLLRFHYFVDLLGGLVVAAIGLAVAWAYGRKMESVGNDVSG